MSGSDIIIYNTYSGIWVTIFTFCYMCVCIVPVHCHIPSYASTPSNKIQQFCDLAVTCIHDTIPICGRMGDEKRTFLDLCDLLEFACDTNQVFNHVDDMQGCPTARPIS